MVPNKLPHPQAIHTAPVKLVSVEQPASLRQGMLYARALVIQKEVVVGMQHAETPHRYLIQ
jgi:hypothetical protein